MTQNSLDRSYFDELYERDPDPWKFATSSYEREKYTASLGALDRDRYERVLEIGCSIGVFTQRLAPRCDDLVAVDISEPALAQARERCAGLRQVRFAQMTVPAEFPPGPFDLIVCAEVGYYWSDADLARARDHIAHGLATQGELLLVHWLPVVEEYLRPGDAVHEAFLDDGRFVPVTSLRADRYRLDLLRVA